MQPKDKEKTAFMTVDANNYYEIMPFDLKNGQPTSASWTKSSKG